MAAEASRWRRLIILVLLTVAPPANILFRSLLENPGLCGFLSPTRQFLYGCLYAQPVLLAFWAVLGPRRCLVQWLPAAILVACLGGANVAAWSRANDGILFHEWVWTEPFNWFLLFLTPHFPLWYLRRRRGWRLRFARADGLSVEPSAQFTLSGLILAITLLSAGLAAARHLTPFHVACWRDSETVPLGSFLYRYCWETAWLSVVGCAWIAWVGAILGKLPIWEGGAVSMALVVLGISAVDAVEAVLSMSVLPFWINIKNFFPIILYPSLGMGAAVTAGTLLARSGGWRFDKFPCFQKQ